MKRRDFFLTVLPATAGFTFLSRIGFGAGFNRPKVKWGVAIITWGEKYLESFNEVSGLGIKGIQIRGNVFSAFRSNPQELRAMLESKGLKAQILSGGNIPHDVEARTDVVSQFEEMAKFVKALGGKYLQATTAKRDAYPPGKEKLIQLANGLNKVGEVVRKSGVRLLLHNHMHQLCQNPEEVEMILRSTDPGKVGFLLDIAHFAQAGGNPSDAILKFKDRLELLHIKDLMSPKPEFKGKDEYNYQFMELGRGNRIQMEEVLGALQKIRFKGWCMIELDSVPNPQDTPLRATQTSLEYLTSRFGYSFIRK